jgi:hypothetical protein
LPRWNRKIGENKCRMQNDECRILRAKPCSVLGFILHSAF